MRGSEFNITRIPGAGFNMAGLARVDELVDRVESGERLGRRWRLLP